MCGESIFEIIKIIVFTGYRWSNNVQILEKIVSENSLLPVLKNGMCPEGEPMSEYPKRSSRKVVCSEAKNAKKAFERT